jgi:hypothetical protein
VLDFNRAVLSEAPISVAINALIEQAEPPEENTRQYLGASSIGSDCLRKIQYETLDRHNQAAAPLHGITAPAAGTGKSLLVDVLSILATGIPMPVIAPGRGEEELEKRLSSALLSGDVAISIDNCVHDLESSFLCQALTQQKLNIRLLGQSKNVEVPVTATFFATGNNLGITGDLARRTIMCSLDAQCEHPERRHFDTDAAQLAGTNRAEFVTAGLTVLHAWHAAGERIDRPPFGSFEDWSQRIRAPLLWLGQADPCDTTLAVQEEDPRRLELEAVVTEWRRHIGLHAAKTVKEVIDRAVVTQDLHVALLSVAGNRAGGMVNNRVLGKWLGRNEDRIVKGLKFTSRTTAGCRLWSLTPVQ